MCLIPGFHRGVNEIFEPKENRKDINLDRVYISHVT